MDTLYPASLLLGYKIHLNLPQTSDQDGYTLLNLAELINRIPKPLSRLTVNLQRQCKIKKKGFRRDQLATEAQILSILIVSAGSSRRVMKQPSEVM